MTNNINYKNVSGASLKEKFQFLVPSRRSTMSAFTWFVAVKCIVFIGQKGSRVQFSKLKIRRVDLWINVQNITFSRERHGEIAGEAHRRRRRKMSRIIPGQKFKCFPVSSANPFELLWITDNIVREKDKAERGKTNAGTRVSRPLWKRVEKRCRVNTLYTVHKEIKWLNKMKTPVITLRLEDSAILFLRTIWIFEIPRRLNGKKPEILRTNDRVRINFLSVGGKALWALIKLYNLDVTERFLLLKI